jgi:hypothetical protein
MAESQSFVSFHFSIVGFGLLSGSFGKLVGLKVPLDGERGFVRIFSSEYPCDDFAGQTGQLYITEIAGNFSGTFSITLSDANCNAVEVTFGRFDYLLTPNILVIQ